MSSGAKRAMLVRDGVESRMGTRNVHAGEDGDGAGGVTDHGADAQPEQGEEGEEGSGQGHRPQHARLPERRRGRAAREDGLTLEERDEAERLADDERAPARRRRPWPSAARPRRGMAASDERIVPVPYSPLMARIAEHAQGE